MKRKTQLPAAGRALCLLLGTAYSATCVAGPDGCVGGICQGNQSAGVNVAAPPTALSVSSLSTNIAPLSGVSGVRFASQGSNGSDGETLPIHGTNADDGAAGSLLNLNVLTGTHTVTTTGDYAYGVATTSVGGNGGVGGVGFLLLIPVPFPPFIIPTPGFGGKGGSGGNGGEVDAVIEAQTIQTGGANAAGVLATSQAGIGGDGGYAVGIYGGGGDGGVGGTGGTITLTVNGGSIVTTGSAAPGIAAQSTGGAGGNGGSGDGAFGSGGTSLGSGPGGSVTVNNHASVTTSGVYAYGIFAESQGGAGGAGGRSGGLVTWGASTNSAGAGGSVTINNQGAITTNGTEAYAILAQSTGGGGGVAGNSFGLFASMGGDGSAQGNGGAVGVTNSGLLKALGTDAVGIYAYSLGGGGGLGGKAAGLTAFGGNGSVSGDGGVVTVTNHGEIQSTAQAIFAESLGGGGGSGGTSGSLLVTIGGNGASGGDGGAITVTNDGKLTTSESDAAAIHAWSTGGGGGHGAGAEDYGVFIAFAYGGSSSAGGDGGDVTILHSLATLHTLGDRSHGIDAVSLGGGGGSGGDAITFEGAVVESLSESIGGSGSGGGDGGAVKVGEAGAAISGTIMTEGDHAHGIRAASIGGGGGAGGESAAFSFDTQVPNVPFAVSATLSLGGDAGGGGAGGEVGVVNAAAIETSGFRSQGIFAESVGGGGGEGGRSLAVTVLARVTADFEISLGGSGGDGGMGKAVTVTNTGELNTSGAFANGILIESVGGGGGAGGTALGLHTSILGGPLPKVDGSAILTLGGTGGDGGAGGLAQVDNSGKISTQAEFANGILAQSVGGGGGYGGLLIQSDARLGVTGAGLDIKLGASYSGIDGDGGQVIVNHAQETIHTQGDFAHAIMAQSVGGGGGYVAASVEDDDLDVGVDHATITSAGSGAGSGGEVKVQSSGLLKTDGNYAYGIFAQSVGGGGGYAVVQVKENLSHSNLVADPVLRIFGIDPDSVVEVGSAGGAGDGGSVTVAHTGDITTQGKQSHGIVAMSTGGRGIGGGVTVTVSGNVSANGQDADGIYASSSGESGAGDIGVTLLNGTIQGGSGSGAGVAFSGGAANVLTNRGTISALSGMAVLGGSGNEIIANYGQMSGNISLGSGSNYFNNQVGGRFLPGNSIVLGTGGTLSNAGTLSPGGANLILATSLAGSLTQESSGTYAVDLDTRTLSADRIDATGSLALSGTADISLSRRGLVRPGTYQIDILTAGEGVNGRFTTVILPASTPLLKFSLGYLPDAVQLQTQAAGFRTIATNPLGDAVARHLDLIAPTVGGDLAEAMGEMQTLTLNFEFSQALTSLSPERYEGLTRTALAMSTERTRYLFERLDMLRQDQGAMYAAGGAEPIRLAYAGSGGLFAADDDTGQGGAKGFWLDGSSRRGDWNADPGYTSYDYHFTGLAAGIERRLSEHLILGAALGYGQANLDYDATTGDGEVSDRQAAIYASYQVGRGYVDVALSYARQHFNLTRELVVGGMRAQAASQHDGNTLEAAVTGGAELPLSSWRVGPYAGLRYVAVDEDGFNESGAGGVGLVVAPRRIDSLSAELGARVHIVLKREHGDLVPAFGLSLDHDFRIDQLSITAAYLDAPGSNFVIPAEKIGANGLRASAGISYVTRTGLSTSLRYDVEHRSGYRSDGLIGELRYEF